MSSVTTPKSERSPTLTAVLFMILFVAAFVMLITVKDNITGFACQYEALKSICSGNVSPSINSEQFTRSMISSACVDTQGLQITLVLGSAVDGRADVQVFTTGEDVFPTEQGMSDSFKMSLAIPAPTNRLDFVIPVESMPVGEHIFGNIVTTREKVISSYVAYFVKVSDCSTTDSPSANPTLMTSQEDIPIQHETTCLPGNRLMVAFEFDKPVFGQYQAMVAGRPYQLVSVGNQPAALFFSGEHPGGKPVAIRLLSATDQAVLFEESSTPPVCDTQLQ
ncbi:MAG TPA: hypothetical protein VFR47_02130 [Anaerolineales bacterium]|nr:hypothetical protein [Anaerolineales bacterium]